jgi:uncharacterized membrane protein YbhN (UPF0104 family)
MGVTILRLDAASYRRQLVIVIFRDKCLVIVIIDTWAADKHMLRARQNGLEEDWAVEKQLLDEFSEFRITVLEGVGEDKADCLPLALHSKKVFLNLMIISTVDYLLEVLVLVFALENTAVNRESIPISKDVEVESGVYVRTPDVI